LHQQQISQNADLRCGKAFALVKLQETRRLFGAGEALSDPDRRGREYGSPPRRFSVWSMNGKGAWKRWNSSSSGRHLERDLFPLVKSGSEEFSVIVG